MTEDDRPLGAPLENWQVPPVPAEMILNGRHVRVEPLSPEHHAADLHGAFEGHDALWDYMPSGPFRSVAAFRDWIGEAVARDDMVFYALAEPGRGSAGGMASYLRIAPGAGTIEVGHIAIAPRMQKSRAATEAMYLLMKWAFEAGYRRYEWKCNALNRASRRAAQRLGFSYEGTFRQAAVIKGRNRDTAWFSVIDGEWPALRAAFETWLSDDNFAADGTQEQRLSVLTRPLLAAPDPTL